MNDCFLINPTKINAYWVHGLLFLAASGEAECPQYVNISQSPLRIFPPQYQVMGCACPEIGSFPYKVHAWFHVPEQPETVTVHTADGPQEVDVKAFPIDLIEDVATPKILTEKPAAGEVVGISPNSWDVNRAIGDAVSQLQKQYPGKVSAIVTEIGVVAVGSPVGIAFLYVNMKQSAQAARASGAAKKSSASKTSSAKASSTSKKSSASSKGSSKSASSSS
jgi:hypothetical protein